MNLHYQLHLKNQLNFDTYFHGENDIDAFVFLFEIKITKATESSEVDFSDSVVGSSFLQGSNLGPGGVVWIVLEHLQTSKTSHHQLKNSTKHLVCPVTPINSSTGYNHFLVQVSSSETVHRPGKNLLCTEQHY